MIYHIALAADWAERREAYAPTGWRDEGFIHCSTSDQLVRVANHHFGGHSALVLLCIDPTRLASLVVWEDTSDAGEDYPHIYGMIDVAAVVAANHVVVANDGIFDESSFADIIDPGS